MAGEEWSPYEGTSPVAALDHHAGRVTLVEGQTFCLSGRTGDVLGDLPRGLFVLDRRALSVWELRLNGHRLEPLAVDEEDPFTSTFVGRGRFVAFLGRICEEKGPHLAIAGTEPELGRAERRGAQPPEAAAT